MPGVRGCCWLVGTALARRIPSFSLPSTSHLPPWTSQIQRSKCHFLHVANVVRSLTPFVWLPTLSQSVLGSVPPPPYDTTVPQAKLHDPEVSPLENLNAAYRHRGTLTHTLSLEARC